MTAAAAALGLALMGCNGETSGSTNVDYGTSSTETDDYTQTDVPTDTSDTGTN